METLPTKKAVEEIEKLHEEIVSSLNESIRKGIRIGELLTGQKERLKHGEWLPWIKQNLSFSDQTARNYMKVFSNREMLYSKGVLNLGQAYQLLLPPKESLSIIDNDLLKRELQVQDTQWEELPEKDEHEKMVKVKDLDFNPFFGIWTIEAEFIERLKNSIEQVGFLPGFMARKRNGKYQIAYGHHRLIALRLTKIEEVAIYLREMDDIMMVKVMVDSNRYRINTKYFPDVDKVLIIDTVRAVHDFLTGRNENADMKSVHQIMERYPEHLVRDAYEQLYSETWQQ